MAKPILDLVAEVTDLTDLDVRRPEFEAIGYVWRGEYGIPGRRYIRPDNNRVHWHCYAQGSERVHEHLVFRDYLRTYPAKAHAYEAAKIDAMAKHDAGSSSYVDEKSPTLEALLAEAAAWAAARKLTRRGTVLVQQIDPKLSCVLHKCRDAKLIKDT